MSCWNLKSYNSPLLASFDTLLILMQKYAMQQAFKSMMTQAPPNTFGSNSPFPFAMPPQAAPAAPSSYPYSQPRKDTSPQSATVDVSATKVEATGTLEEADVAEQPKKKFGIGRLSLRILLQLSVNRGWSL